MIHPLSVSEFLPLPLFSEQRAPRRIIRQNASNQRVKRISMVFMNNVSKLMHNNIVHRFRRILHQPPGKAKPVFHAAAPEARFCRGDFNRCGDKAHDTPIMRYARRDRLFGKRFQERFLLRIRCVMRGFTLLL